MPRFTRTQRNWLLILISGVVIVALRLIYATEYLPDRPTLSQFNGQVPRVVASQTFESLRPNARQTQRDHATIVYADADADADADVLHVIASSANGLGGMLAHLHRSNVYLEFQSLDDTTAERLCAVLQQVKTAREGGGFLVGSPDHASVTRFREQCPGWPTVASDQEGARYRLLKWMGLPQLFTSPAAVMHLEVSTEASMREDVSTLRDLGIETWIGPVSGGVAMRAVVRSGAQGILTAEPVALLEELGRR